MRLAARPLDVTIGCEASGIVREAFRALGHNAVSVDLRPAEDGSEHHEQGELLEIMRRPGRRCDLLIAHPDCTYLCSSGLHWNHRTPGRAEKTEAAVEFVRAILALDVPMIAVENPRGRLGTAIRKADQKIQPYQFGSDASKETHLWLKGLPPLVLDPAQFVPGRIVGEDKRGKTIVRWANQTDSGQNRLGPSEDRWRQRSLTYPGIAAAFASQWGGMVQELRQAA